MSHVKRKQVQVRGSSSQSSKFKVENKFKKKKNSTKKKTSLKQNAVRVGEMNDVTT